MTGSPTFDAVCEMETPPSTIDDLCSALMMISETMRPDESVVVMRLATLAQDHCKAAEAVRAKLYDLSHPGITMAA
jgi:hypothetical protein